jgi:hypothetical protein
LPTFKLQRQIKGDHPKYQENLKKRAETSAFRFKSAASFSGESAFSMNKFVKELREALAAVGIDACKSTYSTHVQNAVGNDCGGLCPQAPYGVALPSNIEKRSANLVRGLRERIFFVCSRGGRS